MIQEKVQELIAELSSKSRDELEKIISDSNNETFTGDTTGLNQVEADAVKSAYTVLFRGLRRACLRLSAAKR